MKCMGLIKILTPPAPLPARVAVWLHHLLRKWGSNPGPVISLWQVGLCYRINFLDGHRGFASVIKLWQATILFVKFKGACDLLLAPVQKDRWAGWACCSRYTLPYRRQSHARLIVFWGCPLTSSTAGAWLDSTSLINTAQSPSTPPLPSPHSAPLYTNTAGEFVTRQCNPLVIVGYSPHRVSGAAHWARKPHWGLSAGVPI